MVQVLLPELGEGITTAVISCWYAKPGDVVKEGDDIVELVTDKAAFNVSATTNGKIKKVFSKEGDEVKIGAVLAEIA